LIPLDIILGLGSKLIDSVFPDPAKKAEAQLKLLELQQSGELAQMQAQTAINVEEAKSSSTFIAGWRPFIGWVCGTAFAINFIVGPMGVFMAALAGKAVVFPTLALSEMMPVLLGMLGLGAYRTFEKVKDAEGNR
jgi:roadblock/LC7 domain-containing protein